MMNESNGHTDSPYQTPHGPMQPEEFDDFAEVAALITRQGGTAIKAKLKALSPFGVELEPDTGQDLVPVGTSVEVRFNRLGRAVMISGQTTDATLSPKRLFVRACARRRTTAGVDIRLNRRFFCDPLYAPTGIASNPLRFNDTIYFRVRDISSQGLRILTSLRNKYIFVGHELNCSFTFPLLGNTPNCQMRVSSVSVTKETPSEALAVGLKFVASSQSFVQMAGRYLLQFGKLDDGTAPSPKDVKSAGFTGTSAGKALELDYARTPEEYDEVLNLRLDAFRAVVDTPPDAKAKDWGDHFDAKARILTVRYRGKLVASCRLIMAAPDGPLEHDALVQLPNTLPDRKLIVEVSRTCTHPAYRGDDLLMMLFRHIVLNSLESGRRFMMANCVKNLLPIYERVGCKYTGVKFRHATDGNEHYVFLGDLSAMLLGRGISPLAWSLLCGSMWQHVKHLCETEATSWDRLRLGFYRKLQPLTHKIIKYYERPKKRKAGEKRNLELTRK